ncbi:quinone oxidoreductase family protein [Nonomuraea aridisoli]|uniref:NADPH:quinone reductase n=1 Tax=Nonomuraea aridisoli TaxID=2070368 RepID=A0A2W2ETU2_9ACTN|nr:zinc-binding dehydrogenase [Nonomuraea aridisoli]PZG15838.1 NADPH:quinone reductase [Nonomuraea aridisoli]
MRAALIESCARPPVPADRPVPAPGPGWEAVRVAAAPITPLDLLCAGGTSYFGVPDLPYVPGVQGVGTAGGRLVWFPASAGMAPGDGSMAEVALARSEDLVELPAGADPYAVAALGLSAVAAYMALTWRGELRAGEQVLVLGAGGVVGQAAVQLARLAGARRVIAAARSAAALERARRTGADAVVPLGPCEDAHAATGTGTAAEVAELAARLNAACDGPVDLVLDPLYGVPAAAAARTLREGGRLVNLGGSASETCALDSSTLRSRSLRILGYTNTSLTREQRTAAITHVAEQSAAGRLAVAYEVMPLDQVTEAWQRQADGTAKGRIVLRTA